MNTNPNEGANIDLSSNRELMINLLCRVLSHKTSREDLIELLGELSDVEWNAFHQAVQQKGFSPLLYRLLKELGDAVVVPESIMTMMHESVLTATTRNMLMLHEAGLILKALHSKKLEVIPLKGLFLVENVYKDISLRSFSDLDLLVHTDDLDSVIACMQGIGYHLETYYSTQDANKDIKHVPPMRKPDGQLVEIHWSILEENEPFTITVDGFWARAVPARVAGVDVFSLSVEDLLLHLCVHLGYQHRLKIGLRGLYDIAEVLHHFMGEVDWQKVVEIAQEWGVERVIWLVLKLAEKLLGAEVPQDVYGRLMGEAVADKVLAEARVQLLEGEGQGVVMTPDLARLATTHGVGEKLKVMLSRVFIPRQVMARLYNVSPKSPAIIGCYFRRFKELVKRYGPALKPVLSKDKAVMVGVTEEEVSKRLKEWMGKQK